MLMCQSDVAALARSAGGAGESVLAIDRRFGLRETVSPRTNTSRWARLLRSLTWTVRLWQDRSETRHALSELDGRLLNDIGKSRAEAQRESVKPFWKP